MSSLTWLASCWLIGCSADEVSAPEPTLRTPGAFVAVEDAPGTVRLFRTLQVVQLQERNDGEFVLSHWYAERAQSFDEARELSRTRELSVETARVWINLSDFDTPHEVVWFRSLTEDELKSTR
jgi:hypothetical protein